MVPQQHHVLAAEIAAQRFRLAGGIDHAFEIVGCDIHADIQRVLTERQQAFRQRRDSHSVVGVKMDRTIGIRPSAEHRAMHPEGGGVEHQPLGHFQHIALKVHAHQAGGSNLLEHQPEGVHQEAAIGQPRRHVGGDMIVPAEMRGEAEGGGEFHPRLALFLAH